MQTLVKSTVKVHTNCLICPQCSNLLVDQFPEYEKDKEIKSVKCSNICDFIGKRQGFKLLSLQEIKDLDKK